MNRIWYFVMHHGPGRLHRALHGRSRSFRVWWGPM